jgi:hypothetical protein
MVVELENYVLLLDAYTVRESSTGGDKEGPAGPANMGIPIAKVQFDFPVSLPASKDLGAPIIPNASSKFYNESE